MGMLLSRPLLINERHCSVKRPTANLEFDPAKPDLPCPHQHMVLQQDLCESVMAFFDGTKLGVKQVDMAVAVVRQWLDSLLPAYRLTATDTRYDESDSYIVLQRLQTVSMGHTSILSVVKTYLTQTYGAEPALTPTKLYELQNLAIDECIKLMSIAQTLADMYIPDYNKYFLIVFTPLDVSALLCSAIIHDVRYRLPRRNEILETIAKGQCLLRRLARVTRTGTIALKAITELVAKFNITPQETTIFDQARSQDSPPSSKRLALSDGSRENSDSDVPGLSPDAWPGISTTSTTSQSAQSVQAPTMSTTSQSTQSLQATSTATSTATTPPQPIMSAIPATSVPAPNMNVYPDPYATNDFAVQGMMNFDFGELEPIFNWRNVNLFENNDHVFDSMGGYN